MKRCFSEDWTSTIVGTLIIAAALVSYIGFNYLPKWVSFGWNDPAGLANVFSAANLGLFAVVFALFLVFIVIANLLQGKFAWKNILAFAGLFVITGIAQAMGGWKVLNEWGFEAVIFCLVIGLIISNLIGTPDWLKPALRSEFYVKTGLVLLGSTILFHTIMKAGSQGLIQALVVILSVWYFCFWICRKMKIDKELTMMLSSAVSICGVSAAIATSGAIKGDEKKLSYVVSLVMVIAVPMILIMPVLARWLNLSEMLAGAWIGGTIDTTGAVAATGALYGKEALDYATIVKSSQNVLLGVAAFLIAIYWAATNKKTDETYTDKPSLKVIWDRFPKFVIGFIVASLVFSFLIPGETAKEVSGLLKKSQGLWFALGFTSIGLETNFKSLFNSENRRATWAFLIAQLFNVLITLLVAYLIFGNEA
ncbi:MAG: YeiH family protein [Tannerella sp.]|nr:YeiH family protein [Tannerella sp.]